MRTPLSALILLLAPLAPLPAQNPPSKPEMPAECQDVLKDFSTASPGSQRDAVIADALKLQRSPTCFARLFVQRPSVASAGFSSFLKRLEALRTDKQAGSSSGAGGGTNLASKGTTAKLMSVAAEYGALTESVNQQVVTVQGSLESPFVLLVRKNLVSYCLETSKNQKDCAGESWLSALRRLSYGVSFNTNPNNKTVTGAASGQPNGTTQPVTFTASGNQISAWNARIVLWNQRDDVSKDFQKKWNDLLAQSGTAKAPPTATDKTAAGKAPAGAADSTTPAAPSAQPLHDAAKALIKPLEEFIKAGRPATGYDEWYHSAFLALQNANPQEPGALEAAWRQAVDRYLDMVEKNNPKVTEAAIAFIAAMSRYDFEQREFVEAVAEKPVVTLEYTNNRPIAQPSTSSIRLIFDKGLKSGVSITANGAVAVYNSTLPQSIPGVNRFRDAQFAVQLQKDLGTLSLVGAAAISGTYYFQYQNSPAILNVTPGTPLPGITFTGLPANATQVFSQKGNLHVGQIRLVLGAGQSSVRFPLAISYSNRSELIPKPTWKAQLGISYDFDSLFTK